MRSHRGMLALCLLCFQAATALDLHAQVHSELKPDDKSERYSYFKEIFQSPNGNLIVGIGNPRLVGFDARSGKEKFSYAAPTNFNFYYDQPSEGITADGKTIVVNDGATTFLIDSTNGTLRTSFKGAGVPVVPSQGNIIALCDLYNDQVHIHADDGRRLISTIGFAKGENLSRAALSADGKLLACLVRSGNQESIRLLSVANAETLRESTRVKSPRDLAFVGDGKTLAVCGRLPVPNEWGVMMFSVPDLKPVCSAVLPYSPFMVAASPDGKWLAASDHDRTFLVDIKEGLVCGTLYGHHVERLAFSRDSKLLLTMNRLEKIVRWDIADATRTASPKFKYKLGGIHFAMAPHEPILAASSWERLGFWDLRTGKQLDNVGLPKNGRNPERAYFRYPAFSPDGKRLAALARVDNVSDGGLAVYDLAARRFIHTQHARDISISGPPAFSPDGKKLLLFGRGWSNKSPTFLSNSDSNFQLDTTTWSPAPLDIGKNVPDVRPLRLCNDQKTAYMGMSLIDLTSKQRTLPDTDYNLSWLRVIRKSSDENLLVGLYSHFFCVWDLRQDRFTSPFNAFNGGQRGPYADAMVLAPNDQIVAIASRDNFVWLWELTSGRLLTRLPHEVYPEHVLFTPDSQMLVSIDREGVLYGWDVTPWTKPLPPVQVQP